MVSLKCEPGQEDDQVKSRAWPRSPAEARSRHGPGQEDDQGGERFAPAPVDAPAGPSLPPAFDSWLKMT